MHRPLSRCEVGWYPAHNVYRRTDRHLLPVPSRTTPPPLTRPLPARPPPRRPAVDGRGSEQDAKPPDGDAAADAGAHDGGAGGAGARPGQVVRRLPVRRRPRAAAQGAAQRQPHVCCAACAALLCVCVPVRLCVLHEGTTTCGACCSCWFPYQHAHTCAAPSVTHTQIDRVLAEADSILATEHRYLKLPGPALSIEMLDASSVHRAAAAATAAPPPPASTPLR